MSELFDTIEMKALDQAERERIANEERQAERRRAAKAKRTKAAASMAARLFAAIVLFVACWAAGEFGLIAKQLIVWLYAAIGSWLAFWFGAFVQFMWCKGGYMEC